MPRENTIGFAAFYALDHLIEDRASRLLRTLRFLEHSHNLDVLLALKRSL
jgi:hypothetical protein